MRLYVYISKALPLPLSIFMVSVWEKFPMGDSNLYIILYMEFIDEFLLEGEFYIVKYNLIHPLLY